METPIDWEDYQQFSDGVRWDAYQKQLAEVERLNLELAQGKFREGAVCGYCSHSGSLMLAEVERLKQTANNGAECSKCLGKAAEPICMYCDECYGDLTAEIEQLRSESKRSDIPCCKCGGPVIEFSIPNAAWNTIIRDNDPATDQEYLCLNCFADIAAEKIERLREEGSCGCKMVKGYFAAADAAEAKARSEETPA